MMPESCKLVGSDRSSLDVYLVVVDTRRARCEYSIQQLGNLQLWEWDKVTLLFEHSYRANWMRSIMKTGRPQTVAAFRGQLVIIRTKRRQTIMGRCCTQCKVSSVYGVLGVWRTRCMAYSVYGVLGVWRTRWKAYSVYATLGVRGTC
jgi:hypothetical protein